MSGHAKTEASALAALEEAMSEGAVMISWHICSDACPIPRPLHRRPRAAGVVISPMRREPLNEIRPQDISLARSPLGIAG